MNNRIIQIIAVFVLSLLALFLVLRHSIENKNYNLHNFTKLDTALVDKIVLHDSETCQMILERSSNGWLVNEEFITETNRVDLLLSTLKQFVIKSPVSLRVKDSIAIQLQTQGVKVELLSKGKKLSSFFVGSTYSNNKVTYLMASDVNEPFWVELPDFSSEFSSRFSVNEAYWKGQQVFNYDLKQISSLTVQYPNEPEKERLFCIIF